MKATKKIMSVFLAVVLSLGLTAACSDDKQSTPEEDSGMELPDAGDAFFEDGDTIGLKAGGFRLELNKQNSSYGVAIAASEGTDMYVSENPAIVRVRGKAQTLLGAYPVEEYAAPYASVKKTSYGFACEATLDTPLGSTFRILDRYYLTGGVFAADREVKVVKAGAGDLGFESLFSFLNTENSKSDNDFEFVIPSIIYKDTENMVNGSIASNLTIDKVYVKETRAGMPFALLRSRKTGYSLAVQHLKPQISVHGVAGGGSNGEINDDLQYGSIGFNVTTGVSVNFCYPCAEGPTTYDAGAGWVQRFHKVEAGNSHAYKVALIAGAEEEYTKTLTSAYKKAYLAEQPAVTDRIDIDEIYENNIEVFTKTYQEFGTDKISAGCPWSIPLNGAASEYTFQMGFVGQQAAVGYHLLRSGYAKKDEKLINQGKKIIDFWTSDTIMGGALPAVWWDPADNDRGGSMRAYPSFLRCFVDGMEGILDAYLEAGRNGVENPAWKNAVLKVGNFLIENQNQDGSFYRAYNTNGTVCTDTSNADYQGDSKLNTPVAVRFLGKLYELTGEEAYKNAALKAADFAYETLYKKLGKYVGGTPDNPNTVDKEAAIYALYCFDTAYTLTKDKKYLDAAEHAAVSFMSWVYTYDFAVPVRNSTDSAINCFSDGRVIGFSLIATGHSGADNFSAYCYYEMYRMYAYTGDEFYLHCALLLQNNTKLSTDYDGSMKYPYKALGPEATNCADFGFQSVGVWLPWSGIANIEPIANMKNTFGETDIAKIDKEPAALSDLLNAYGIGGKLS